jgi:hypothetical protein
MAMATLKAKQNAGSSARSPESKRNPKYSQSKTYLRLLLCRLEKLLVACPFAIKEIGQTNCRPGSTKSYTVRSWRMATRVVAPSLRMTAIQLTGPLPTGNVNGSCGAANLWFYSLVSADRRLRPQ